MAIKSLTDEQVATWTREQKDTWWLQNVYRGNMAQLTLRSAFTGFLMGGILSATNLYIGAKTGWTLGVGLTSVILAFATFRVLSKIPGVKDFTILENNAMQSIATSAGYMTGPLISGLAAYMMVTNRIISPWHMMWFNLVLSVLGVLIAFPLKRRFINDEQQPFPEGRACGVLLDTLYTSESSVGVFKAKALAIAALAAGSIKFLSGESYQELIQGRWLGLERIYWLADHPLDRVSAWLKARGHDLTFTLWKVDPSRLDLSPTLNVEMFGAGGLMNIRYAANLFAGMFVTYWIAAPLVVASKILTSPAGKLIEPGVAFRRTDVLNGWLLWPGVTMLVLASLLAFLAKPKMIIDSFKGLFKKKDAQADVLKDIELPVWVSLVGVPLVGAIGVWMAHSWFDVKWHWGALAIVLIIALTLIAVNATALTSTTPTGSLSKISQITFGGLDKKFAATGSVFNPGVNLMTACMTTEVASNASNLLMDIKPGYMLGAKPRQQVIGHIIGIVSGAMASTPLFFVLFLSGHPANPFSKPNPEMADKRIYDFLVTEKFSFTAAVQWKGINDLIANGLTNLPDSAKIAMLVCGIFGVAFEVLRIVTKNKSPVSPVAFGLGIVLPPDSSLWMFMGSLFFWVTGKMYAAHKASIGNKVWIQTHEPICAGLIAGAAIIGIGDILVKVFLLN